MSCLLVFKISSASNRFYQVHVSYIGMRRVSIEIKTTSRLAVMNPIYNHRHQPVDLGISNDSCYGVIFHYGFSYPIQQLLLQRLPVTLLFSFFLSLFDSLFNSSFRTCTDRRLSWSSFVRRTTMLEPTPQKDLLRTSGRVLITLRASMTSIVVNMLVHQSHKQEEEKMQLYETEPPFYLILPHGFCFFFLMHAYNVSIHAQST